MVEGEPAGRPEERDDAEQSAFLAEEFEPDPPADPEEPETLDGDEDAEPAEIGEADSADVAEQLTVVDDEDDGYDRD